MNSIYIVFSATSLKMGKIIRMVTKNKYNHASFSFDKNLQTLYSFARYNKHAPLCGGLVKEDITRYYENEKNAANIKLCEIALSNDEYKKAKFILKRYLTNQKRYTYNSFSAVLMPVGINFKINDTFTCVEWIISVLDEIGIIDKSYAKRIVSIKEAEEILADYVIYEGKMFRPQNKLDFNDDYFKEIGVKNEILTTISHFVELVERKISQK